MPCRSPSAPALAAPLAAVAVVATACTTGGTAPTRADDLDVDLTDREALVAAADGQTVQWWLFGGDDRINAYVDEHVVPAAADLGVTLERVPVTDTADAVGRVRDELAAGTSDGAVDLVWINGENFATGKAEGLWLEDWATRLPNADLVDPATVDEDFGVAVEGQESPWSRALFVLAHDTTRTPRAPTDLDALLAYARDNPGSVTYPAPPDFTGSAFVRQVVATLGEDEGFAYLRELAPLLWRKGTTHPADEAELNELFGNGEVDLAMSYDPAFVATAVASGLFPTTARPFVLEAGTLHNTSYVAVPRTAGSIEGALLVADLLLEPRLQATKADPAVLGLPTVLDLARLDPDQRALFTDDGAGESPYVLATHGRLVDELPADEVGRLEQRWLDEVLQR